jgi:segregation and condensation protein B
MEFSRLRSVIEALMYVSEGPLPLSRIREAIGDDAETKDIKDALASVIEEFNADGRGVKVAELAGGYQIVTRAEYAVYVKRLQKIKPPKLSAQALETLAIIAYRQPIIRAEIDAIRGVYSGGTLKTLLERRLIKIAGRQDVPGKPIMYATTPDFLRYFGLKDLTSLPPMRELERELGMEENSILSNLEPELPGLDGPEMEAMAEEYRARRAAAAAEEETAEEYLNEAADEALSGDGYEDEGPADEPGKEPQADDAAYIEEDSGPPEDSLAPEDVPPEDEPITE